jgi:glycogen(starch) synthase
MTTDTVGGVWGYSLQLSEALGRYGIEVALATMGPLPTEYQKQAAERLPNLKLHESNYRLEWMENPWQDLERAGTWLLNLEELLRPDIIHLNGYVHGVLPWNAPVCIVAHSCVLSWWEAVRREKAPANWERYRMAVIEGVRGADCIIAPSAAMLSAIHKHYGDHPSSAVIYNGISASNFPSAEKQPFVFCAGRLWDSAKNIEALVRCAANLPWSFVIAGDGELACNLPQNVTLVGKIPPEIVAIHMARATIYCLPARYEPFGLSILEAAYSGCALILGDIPSLRELWESAAVFVDPEDHTAIRNSLSELMSNETKRITLSSLARTRAQNFSDQHMISAYLTKYEQMMSTTTKV